MWENQLTYTPPEFVGNKAKGRISKGCFKKTKHAKFSEKRTITPWCAHVIICFVFLKHQLWDAPFCLITDEI